MGSKKNLTQQVRDALIESLRIRFEKNKLRHKGIDWVDVQAVLTGKRTDPSKLHALHAMDKSQGEPDVVGYDKKTGEYYFYDCSPESPSGRRSLCYDKEGLDSRKEFKPEGSAIEMAAEMGIEILNEEQYRELQKLGKFDAKTSSWLKTPDGIRKLGGAIFGDFRYGHVFVYHNGAQSYYGARGFRGWIKV